MPIIVGLRLPIDQAYTKEKRLLNRLRCWSIENCCINYFDVFTPQQSSLSYYHDK